MYANTQATNMTGYLQKVDDMWVVKYWRSVSHKEPNSFSLPLHPEDVLNIEFGEIKIKEYANVKFEITPIKTLLGNAFVAKIKYYE